MQKNTLKRIKLISIYFGNLFEHYDTALYSFLSPFFATLFFPDQDTITALILTFGIAPLGMIARPIGSLVFGYIGDVQGRNRTLFLSLSGMAVVTAIIGIMPTTNQIGKFAPLLLLGTRILQNIFAAGETIGGAVYFLENVESEKEKDFASSIYGTSNVFGILLASGLVTLLYHFQCVETGWRWLYAGGAVTALFGVIMRYYTPSSSINELQIKKCIPHFIERLKIFWEMRYTVFIIAMASGFSYATYSVSFTLMNGFVPLVSDITKAEITKINTILLILDIILLPVFGALACRFNRNNMMSLAAMTAVVTGVPLFYFLDHSTLPTVIFVRIVFVSIGVWFSATFYSWAQSLVAPEYRCSVISFSYSIGSQLLGGTTATISLWMYKQTSLVSSVSWYWILLAALTFASIYKTRSEAHLESCKVG